MSSGANWSLFRSDCHRLLTENVQTSTCGALCVFTMHRIGQRDVNGVDLATCEELVGIFVAAHAVHAVATGELPQLLRIVADQRRQRAILLRLREGRQDRSLRDVAQADDGVTDLPAGDDALGRPAAGSAAAASAGRAPFFGCFASWPALAGGRSSGHARSRSKHGAGTGATGF